MSDKIFASGHCLCNAVQFIVKNEPAIPGGHCHCEHCQRSSGSGHMSIAFFKEDDLVSTGEVKGYTITTDTGSQYTRTFCPTCGSRLFGYNSARPGIVTIAMGVFNEKDWFKANRIVYHRNKPAWDFMDPDLPSFETMPPIK
ncbi:GFA family protein [Thiolinea disciformis]|uniref:GFA family protein n=1 Tax=Thiolinea disciformis TaxID=125614 RepID=UPI00037A1018|nr:GFA family protein [Thiolinea disciformis]